MRRGSICGATTLVVSVVLVGCSSGAARPSALQLAEALYRPAPPAAQVHFVPHSSDVPLPHLISVAKAVSLARANVGDGPSSARPGVTFGDFTDGLVQDHAVYIVTFTGNFSPPSWGPRGKRHGPPPMNHEENVVVDASSGSVLEWYSYR